MLTLIFALWGLAVIFVMEDLRALPLRIRFVGLIVMLLARYGLQELEAMPSEHFALDGQSYGLNYEFGHK